MLPDCLTQQQDEEVQRVVSLHGLLESCRFREVWGEEGGVGEVTEHIANFSGQIRQCMWMIHTHQPLYVYKYNYMP